MPNKVTSNEIFEKVKAACAADEVEVFVERKRAALTRFHNNFIGQNGEEENLHISVRALHDGRTARASGNKTNDESLARLAKSAYEAALEQPQNPDLLPMPESQNYEAVERFDEATAALSPLARAEAVGKVVERADKNGLTVAGVLASNSSTQTLMNSKGLVVEHAETRAEFSVTYFKGEAGNTAQSGWAKGNFAKADELEVEALAERACQKALDNKDQQEIEPGKYTVILEPAAALDYLGFIFYDFAATAVEDKQSCFTGQLGKQVFGSNIAITDDVFHPMQTGSVWDGEGMPRRKVTLVENGVLKNLVYSRQTAKKLNAEPTGHGFLLPNEYGEAPMNLVFSGGNTSLEEMIRATERGILVTRLWYIREVDPFEKILTGMTRDGTFLVEDGKVKGALRNFRFNQSVKEALHNVAEMGEPVRTAGEESFEMVVPPMKIRDFNFTEVTKF